MLVYKTKQDRYATRDGGMVCFQTVPAAPNQVLEILRSMVVPPDSIKNPVPHPTDIWS